MAIGGEFIRIPGLVATGDLSSSQYLAVVMSSTAGEVKVAGATGIVVGILQNKPNAMAAEVAAIGVCKAKLAASVTVGQLLAPNSTGQLAGTSVLSKYICGIAIEASTSTAGEIHPVLLRP